MKLFKKKHGFFWGGGGGRYRTDQLRIARAPAHSAKESGQRSDTDHKNQVDVEPKEDGWGRRLAPSRPSMITLYS